VAYLIPTEFVLNTNNQWKNYIESLDEKQEKAKMLYQNWTQKH